MCVCPPVRHVQIWTKASASLFERDTPNFFPPAEEASMSQRLCWRCYAVNRAADARGPPAIYSFRGSLGFPQENRSANSRENENASEKLHVPVPYRRSDLRCAVIGSTWSCWGAWLIRNLFPGHAGLGVEEGRGWASRGGCIIVRKKRKNGQELAGAARPVRCVCAVVICDVRGIGNRKRNRRSVDRH